MIKPNPEVQFSGERFLVWYTLSGYNEEDARMIAKFICVEDTIEYPHELVAPGDYHDLMVGQVELFDALENSKYQVKISYAVETTGFELPQFLNVVYGNITFIPGIRVGIRDLMGVYDRPIISTAIKPMGLSTTQLAEMAYQCALGGIDIIKDDHGLSDQTFSPYRERIFRCVEAVQKANQSTGNKSLFFPAVNGRMEEFIEKAHFAKEQGADGIMLMPAFCGMDMVRMLAEDDSLGLPIMSHPGFYGTYHSVPEFGISQFVLNGQLPRLFGADISIFPHYVGRFAPSQEQCRAAADGTEVEMGPIKASLPSPGGGVKPEYVKDMSKFYGKDVICLAAGNLHRMGPDLVENSRVFRQMAEEAI
jgi:ribulose-bisphosphate carboxylase large chain